MKITNVTKAQQVRRVGSTREDGGSEVKDRADVVKLSGASDELTEIAMAQEPNEVDFAALKDAISSGNYKPNLDALADRMLTDPKTIDSLLGE